MDGYTEETFRALADMLPIALYMTDAEGRLTYFNAAAVQLSGRVPQIGTDQWCVTWKIFLPDGTPLPHDQCPMAVALKSGEIQNGVEFVAERPDGSRFWFAPYPTVLRDKHGRITGGANLLLDITDRKARELEAREQFRAIVETTPECVKVVAADGTLLMMNSAGLDMLGTADASTLTGTSVYDLIAPHDRERFREFNERVCRGHKESLEFDLITLRGIQRHMQTHAAPLPRSDGSTAQLGITHDVTERKRAERAGLLLGAIVDSSDDAIISKDLNGIITSWNRSAERLFGYTAEEAVGRPITILIPPDRLDEEPEILARLRSGERVDHFETVRWRKDRTRLNISLSISPVRDASGTIIGASKIARDITARKRAEAALIASEARFRQLADAMPQIVWTALPDGRVDYWNQRWYTFTGFERNETGESNWESILHPEDLPNCRQTWGAALASGTPLKIEFRMWDGRERRWRWFMGHAIAARLPDGTVEKWFGSCVDIDDQKRIEEDLRRANQDLEQFAFSASHDLQEPVRSVKIYSELLTESVGDRLGGDAQELLNFLRKGASRIEMLVSDLLAYTREMNFDPTEEVTDSNEVLRNSLESLAGAIAESGARVTADSLPALGIHGAHLQQLFQNLIGNAIKYRSPERTPEVHVSAAHEEGCWTLAVADNGIGIDSEYKERIFGLFKRLHTSEEYSGTGIGLAICKRIVDRYGGRIWVESEPGVGSTFKFALPER